MRLSHELVQTWSHEPEWLSALPELVADCVERWSLELEKPIDTPRSLVVPAGEVVLKLNAPSHFEAENEADALAAWNGRGAVRLLDRDDERCALLLERCVPGTQLRHTDADEIDVVSALLPRLQIENSDEHPFALLADEADRWAAEVPRRFMEGGEWIDRRLLDEALDIYRTVDRSACHLVNQDLHSGNVLRAEREPWLVIDPKPLVGERELEASGLLRNAASTSRWLNGLVDLGASVSRWLDALAALGLDRERARGWGVAHNLAWAWSDGHGWSGEHVAIARRILTAR